MHDSVPEGHGGRYGKRGKNKNTVDITIKTKTSFLFMMIMQNRMN
jgi:hypothetical protein